MSRFMIVLLTCLVATILASGTAEAAALTKAEKVALKQAIVACKAEAKGKKIKWLSRRKYVNQCVVAALKEHPNMDVARMLRERPELTNIPVEQWPGYQSPTYFVVARARKSVSARRSSAEPMCCSGIFVPGV
jgi:hypothetical protein